MSIFTCCEREDETKYLHTCACPSATFSCESESIEPTLCGYSEYSGFASNPPLKYLTKTIQYEKYDIDRWHCCNGLDGKFYEKNRTGSLQDNGKYVYSYDPLDCSGPTTTTSPPNCFGSTGHGSVSTTVQYCTGTPFTTTFCLNSINEYELTIVSATRRESDITTVNYMNSIFPQCDGNIESKFHNIRSAVFAVEDTEANAIARETPEDGTSCSSTWQTRSTGFSWVKRTSGYTIECDNLVVGLGYKVNPAIRRRTVVIGSFGAWEDVTVTPVTFTATATTETIDQSGSPIALDHIQGYEYEITSVNIEKTA